MEGIDIRTDSRCVLKWLNSEKDLSVFVRNRVKEITSDKDITFYYITSKDNPADIATRGSDMQSLSSNQLWLHGPNWLKNPEKEWPTSVKDENEHTNSEYESEVKKSKQVKGTDVLTPLRLNENYQHIVRACVHHLGLSVKNTHL